MIIYYLNAHDSSTVIFDYTGGGYNPEVIKNHPQVEKFSPDEFENAFNSEYISDLGYIIVEHNEN